MTDYSDLIFLIAAITIYGLLVINTDRTLVMNNQKLSDNEVTYGAISAAQDVMAKARWMPYQKFNSTNASQTINQLENINNNPWYQVTVTVSDTTINGASGAHKKVSVHVTSNYLQNPDSTKTDITQSLVKTNY
ncbi:MAG TPA: hypothetical protein VE868_04570 [Balneolaceae bacterium]|nr:hypothetical protein [Balneolaceae bacterium]